MTASTLPAEPSPAAPPPSGSLAQQLGSVFATTRRDLSIHRQKLRGEIVYVVHDPVAFANHALTPDEYLILCSLGIRTTLGETFTVLRDRGVLENDDDEEFYEFVLNLHGLGLLVVPGIPVEVTLRRREDRLRKQRRSPLTLLMSARLPLGNPDRMLDRIYPWVSWLFHRTGLLLWLAMLAIACISCGDQVGELYGDAANLLSLHKLPILWISIVVLKALHELGHAFALKRFGGRVPDFGILFVFLTPCAYVDANASWTFAKRWQRVVVALAGMYVETFIAFVFAILWASTPPGLLHDVSQSVVVLATITTIVVNINPLIKFDGYYAFSDLVGIYNLQERARANLRSHAERLLLGIPLPPSEARLGERVLLWLYAPASLLYRISLAFGVTALMMTAYPGLGLPLGLAFTWLLILGPIVRLGRHMWTSERLENVRLRARIVTVLLLLGATIAAFSVPISKSVIAPAVLDPGVKYSVRAPSSGFIESVEVADGDVIAPGDSLCSLYDPRLEERIQDVESELQATRVHQDATEVLDPPTARMLAARIESLERRRSKLYSQQTSMTLQSLDAGTVVATSTPTAAGAIQPGAFVREGTELMQVHSQHRFVRVVLRGDQVDRTRPQIGDEAQLRWSCAPLTEVRAVVCETRRSASRNRVPVELPIAGGAEILAREISGRFEADQPYLHVFLRVAEQPLPGAGSGLTARVRLPARSQTIGDWIQRSVLSFFYNWRQGS
ncbi:MAG: site-2 protease family protein [Planctomycetota bacterium]